jgi:hypothetical protein
MLPWRATASNALRSATSITLPYEKFPKSTTNRHRGAEVIAEVTAEDASRFRQNLSDGVLKGFDRLCAGQQIAIVNDD